MSAGFTRSVFRAMIELTVPVVDHMYCCGGSTNGSCPERYFDLSRTSGSTSPGRSGASMPMAPSLTTAFPAIGPYMEFAPLMMTSVVYRPAKRSEANLGATSPLACPVYCSSTPNRCLNAGGNWVRRSGVGGPNTTTVCSFFAAVRRSSHDCCPWAGWLATLDVLAVDALPDPACGWTDPPQAASVRANKVAFSRRAVSNLLTSPLPLRWMDRARGRVSRRTCGAPRWSDPAGKAAPALSSPSVPRCRHPGREPHVKHPTVPQPILQAEGVCPRSLVGPGKDLEIAGGSGVDGHRPA